MTEAIRSIARLLRGHADRPSDLHPRHVLGAGVMRVHPAVDGRPLTSGRTVVRISKLLGTPQGMPDISELTIRLATPRAPHGCWDLVLTSSTGPAERTAMPLPMTSWTRTRWSTRTPFRVNGTVMRFRAVLSDDSAPSGLWLDDIESHLRAGRPLRILVHQATDRDGFVPVGEIGLSTLLTDTTIDFDPESNRPADVEPCPLWRRIR